jgi:hypothetical protein
MRSIIIIIFLAATMFAAPAVAQQACPTLVVTNTGDTAEGDASSPCALIANPGPNGISLRAALFAANNATGSGTITITFAQALAGQTISTTGGLGNPNIYRNGISIIGLVDGNGQPTVTIDGSAMGTNGILLPVIASNFTLQSLRFTGIEQSAGGPAFGVLIAAGALFGAPGNAVVSGINISGNVFVNDPSLATGGNFISLSMQTGSSGALLSNVTITGNSFSNFQGNADAILVQAAGTNNVIQNVVIAGNSFSNITYPVEFVCDDAVNNQILHSRVVANSFNGNLQVVNIGSSGTNGQPVSSNNLIDDTVVMGNQFRGNRGPDVALTSGTTNATANTVSNTQIVNNLMVGDTGFGGVSVAGGRAGGTNNTVQGLAITNNTIANYSGSNGSGGAISINANLDGTTGNTVSGVTVLNTILWNNTPSDFDGLVTPSQVTTSITAQSGYVGVNGNINSDPLFLNASGGDFHLQSESPALHSGTGTGAPAFDFDCQLRGLPPSIGAYEFDGPNICPSTYSAPLTATPTSGPAPLAVTFAASGLALPMTYTINFGDGTTGALSQGSCVGVTAIVGGQGGIQCSGSASHVYTAAGGYSATLLNALGLTVSTVAITVTGAAPKVSFTATLPSTPRDVPRQTLAVPFAGSNTTVPTISSFTASPAAISPFAGGGSVTLSWSVASATSLSISGLGAVIGNSIQVSPSQTTTYTLTANNAQGSVTAQTTVTVAGYRSRRDDPLSR